MSFDPEAWGGFLQDNWWLAVVAIAAIFIVLKLVKTVLKWVLALAIVVGFLVYGGYSIDELKAVGTKVTAEMKDEIIKAAAGDIGEAKYIDNGDGTYTVKTPNLELTGVPNSGEVEVKLKGVSVGTFKMEGAVRELVVQARKATQA